MKEQIIITIGREYGSGGHYIAQRLSEELGITLYDKKLLEEAIRENGYVCEEVLKYDEKPVNVLLSRKIGTYSNSIEEVIAEKTFEFMQDRAESGESFVAVGRCSDYVLRNHPNTLTLFILADKDAKMKRIAEVKNLPQSKVLSVMKKNDKKRKLYHNYYSDIKWGDSRGYDLSVNSSKLGLEGTIKMLLKWIEAFREV